MSGWVEDLGRLVRLSREAQDLDVYGRDWTRFYPSRPSAVAFPGNTEEVCRTLSFCNEHGIAVVPSGGRTGLSAGAVASEGELVLSLERLRSMGEVELNGMTLDVGVGVTTLEVHRHCQAWGVTWPIDLASKGSCQIGGNLATNAGGVRVLRYGSARHWVLGMEVVLMDGSLLRLGGHLHKDNTGLNLGQLMVGSEGILGVITSATLRLTTLPREQQVLLLGLDSWEQALELLQHARVGAGLPLLAFEVFSRSCLEAVLTVQTRRSPFAPLPPVGVLMEVEGTLQDGLELWLQKHLDSGLVSQGVLAGSASERAALWSYREDITESLATLGLMHKNDVAVAVARLPEFIQLLESEVAPYYPGQLHLFGHLGDGNLHINVMKPADVEAETFWEGCQQADALLYELLQRLQGSVSAEHGIGLLKKAALPYSRGTRELDAMRAIKRALDPHGLLNPGKVFDP